MKAKTKVSVEEYRSRHLQKEATEAKERRDRELMEARKAEHARLHEIEIQEAEIAWIKYEEQLCLEERARKEQEVNASQAQQAPKVLGSHTPCFDEHGQELDYHDDMIATESQDCRSWSEYFRQQGDLGAVAIADSLDGEARLLQGPTLESTVGEEAVLLEEETPVIDMRLFLAGLETLTPSMLTEVSTCIEHLRRDGGPIGICQINQKQIASAPSRLTRHTDCGQSHGAGPAESDW